MHQPSSYTTHLVVHVVAAVEVAKTLVARRPPGADKVVEHFRVFKLDVVHVTVALESRRAKEQGRGVDEPAKGGPTAGERGKGMRAEPRAVLPV